MDDDKLVVETIASTYAKQAEWMSKAAAIAFEVAERVLLVGAAKYAAAALPTSSSAKTTLTLVAGALHAILLYWLLTKLWAQSANDYRTFHRALIFRDRWARWLYRGASLAFVLGFAWWMNHIISDLIEQPVGAFARPEAH